MVAPALRHGGELGVDFVHIVEYGIADYVGRNFTLRRQLLQRAARHAHFFGNHVFDNRRVFGNTAELVTLQLPRRQALRQLHHSVLLMCPVDASDNEHFLNTFHETRRFARIGKGVMRALGQLRYGTSHVEVAAAGALRRFKNQVVQICHVFLRAGNKLQPCLYAGVFVGRADQIIEAVRNGLNALHSRAGQETAGKDAFQHSEFRRSQFCRIPGYASRAGYIIKAPGNGIRRLADAVQYGRKAVAQTDIVFYRCHRLPPFLRFLCGFLLRPGIFLTAGIYKGPLFFRQSP